MRSYVGCVIRAGDVLFVVVDSKDPSIIRVRHLPSLDSFDCGSIEEAMQIVQNYVPHAAPVLLHDEYEAN